VAFDGTSSMKIDGRIGAPFADEERFIEV